MRPRNLALSLVLLAVIGWQAWHPRERATPGAGPGPGPTSAQDASPTAALPREVAPVLARIRAGGPFPYERDGVVFGNFEGRLPQRARGYYREYTVPTPGVRHRGARRIIAGGDPPDAFWYTGDHYEHFLRLDGASAGAR